MLLLAVYFVCKSGPKVEVKESSVLDFGSVRCGHSSGAVLHLTNCSDMPTVFEVCQLASHDLDFKILTCLS